MPTELWNEDWLKERTSVEGTEDNWAQFVGKIGQYLSGGIKGTVPGETRRVLEGLKGLMYSPGVEQKPVEMMELAAMGLGGALKGGPSAVESATGTTLGMIKGTSGPLKGLGRDLRKVMQREIKARKEPQRIPGAEQAEFLQDNPEVGKVLKQTWFHGRHTYPESWEPDARNFELSRRKSGNLGEPTGISLSASAKMAGGFGGVDQKIVEAAEKGREKLWDRWEPIYKSPVAPSTNPEAVKLLKSRIALSHTKPVKISRVIPLFEDVPENVVLPGFQGRGTEWAGEELKSAYNVALKDALGMMEALKPDRAKELAEDLKNIVMNQADDADMPDIFATREDQFFETLKEALLNRAEIFNTEIVFKDALNTSLTAGLKKKGYKGILYSPGRYDEYELKMFDPGKVVMLDKRSTGTAASKGEPWNERKKIDKGLVKLFDNAPKQELFNDWEHMAYAHSLKDIYEEIDLMEELRPFYNR